MLDIIIHSNETENEQKDEYFIHEPSIQWNSEQEDPYTVVCAFQT